MILLVSSLFLFSCLGCGAFGLDDLLHGLGVDGTGDEAVADHEARCAVDVERARQFGVARDLCGDFGAFHILDKAGMVDPEPAAQIPRV